MFILHVVSMELRHVVVAGVWLFIFEAAEGSSALSLMLVSSYTHKADVC